MITEMINWGFQEGKTLFGFGYDFRQSNRCVLFFIFLEAWTVSKVVFNYKWVWFSYLFSLILAGYVLVLKGYLVLFLVNASIAGVCWYLLFSCSIF